MNIKKMSGLSRGEKGRVVGMSAGGDIRRRLLDIGLTENTVVECVGKSPLGDPAAYLIRGAVIAIRSDDAEKIDVTEVRQCQSEKESIMEQKQKP